MLFLEASFALTGGLGNPVTHIDPHPKLAEMGKSFLLPQKLPTKAVWIPFYDSRAGGTKNVLLRSGKSRLALASAIGKA